MYPNLKMQMWKVGIRQNRLAQLLHMDETAFSRIVNGFRKPSGELREKIAHALNCDQGWLFEEADPNPPTPPMISDDQKIVID